MTPSNTPNNETVTINGVSMLLSGLSEVSCNVQVINVLEGFSPIGCRKYTITISNGVHCYDCAVLPKLFHLFTEQAVGMFTVVHIRQVSMTEINGLHKVVVLDMIPVLQHHSEIGMPTCWNNTLKRGLTTLSPENHRPNKLICTNDVKNLFQATTSTFDCDAIDAKGTVCDYCTNSPCDWTLFGEEIILHLNEKYVGQFMDGSGIVVDASAENSMPINNRKLRYLAYSAFTLAKHSYLGKKKQVPLPNCVVHGIRDTFPDESNNYVGFRDAKEF